MKPDPHSIMLQQFSQPISWIVKYLKNELEEDELQKLETWLNSDPIIAAWFSNLVNEDRLREGLFQFQNNNVEAAFAKTEALIESRSRARAKKQRAFPSWTKWKYAAVVFGILISVTTWVIIQTNKNSSAVTKIGPRALPSKNVSGKSAVLTMANGVKIELDSSQGIISNQAGIEISNRNGILKYKATGTDTTARLLYNIVSTPKSVQYQLELPDGSRIWLNAGSSVRFPLAYRGNERWMQLNGQAYIEVRANKQLPFEVITNKTRIVALGTSFNVEAYSKENEVRATLVKGSIKIIGEKVDTILVKPGQTATIDSTQAVTFTNIKNTDDVTSWKDGSFRFDNDHIIDVMREIKRWYGVDVEFTNPPHTIVTNTVFNRNKSLADALRYIRQADSNLIFTFKDSTLMIFSK